MSSAQKKIIGIAGAGALVVSAWVGASIYGTQVAENEIRALASRPSTETGIRITNLQHNRSLLSSSGSFGMELVGRCSEDRATNEPFEIKYSLAHLLMPTSPARVEWSAKPTGNTAKELAAIFGQGLALEGKGDVTYGGEFRSSIALPELLADHEGGRLTISPSKGNIAFGKNSLAANFGFDKLVARGNGMAFELSQVAIDADLKDRVLGIGTTSLKVEKISTSLGTGEGFRHATSVSESGDRLEAKITESLRAGAVADKALKDLTLEIAVKDLDKQALGTASAVLSNSCGLQNATADELDKLRKSLRTLLVQGFSVGVTKLAGTVGNGSLEGKLTFEARKASNVTAPIALAKMVTSSGEVILRGDALPADQRKTVLQMGVAQEISGGLKADFQYAESMLKSNGRTFDGGMVDQALRSADLALNTFFDEPMLAKGAPARPAEAAIQAVDAQPALTPIPAEPATPAAPAAAPATTPVAVTAPAAATPALAPTPQASTPADCVDVKACLTQTLKAAAQENVDTVRAIASRIEGFGKPDLGNKAVSRKLNTQGLESLKADQALAAADLFRKALIENPRDVEVAGNLGFALVKADKPKEAVEVLSTALQLDPRRSSTWTPLAEALALAGRREESRAALWVAFQWSGNREKSLNFYADRSEKEQQTRPVLAEMYSSVRTWVTDGSKPTFLALTAK